VLRLAPLFAAPLALAPPRGALADPAANTASATLSRHRTTNALDNPVALADSFTRLRGGFDWGTGHELGETRIAVSADVTRYDTLDLEDDASFQASTSTTIPVTEWLELRGTLSATLSEEGDELALPTGFIATSTALASVTAGAHAGIRFDPRTTLVIEMAATTEEAGATRFPATALPALALQADRERLALSATAMRTEGILAYGVHAGLHLVRAQAAALVPAIALAQYTVKLQGALTSQTGHRLGVAVGAQVLDVEQPAFRQLRPTIEVAAAMPIGDRLSLVAAASAGYDVTGRDDPVAAFVRKAEAALTIAATQRLGFTAGILGARRDNLGLGGSERIFAGFAEGRWTFSERWSVRMRVESSRKMETLTGSVNRAVETQFSLAASL
jgi:hypothetical protein